MRIEDLNKIDDSWTLFLDRDGVINKRIFGGYVTSIEEFEFLPGVLESIKYFSQIFGKIIIITNQQGVGKGIMTESELDIVHNFLQKTVAKSEGSIDGILYCTDLADSVDNCRKPSREMANKAKQTFPEIDFSKSIMVGDSLSDIQFGVNAGMNTVFVTSSEMNKEAMDLAHIRVGSLLEFKSLFDKV